MTIDGLYKVKIRREFEDGTPDWILDGTMEVTEGHTDEPMAFIRADVGADPGKFWTRLPVKGDKFARMITVLEKTAVRSSSSPTKPDLTNPNYGTW